MNKALLAAALATGLQAASALAADTDVSAPYDWSGFYAGGQIGGAVVDGEYFLDTNDILLDRTYELSGESLRYGVLGGYNCNFDNVLAGIEASASFGGSSDSFPIIADYRIESEMLLRLRLGLPWKRMLPYASLGAALAGGKSRDVSLGSETAWHLGLTAGAGLEYALTDRIALRGEYMFASYGKATYEFSDANNNFDDTAHWDEHSFRAAVIWRFGR